VWVKKKIKKKKKKKKSGDLELKENFQSLEKSRRVFVSAQMSAL